MRKLRTIWNCRQEIFGLVLLCGTRFLKGDNDALIRLCRYIHVITNLKPPTTEQMDRMLSILKELQDQLDNPSDYQTVYHY